MNEKYKTFLMDLGVGAVVTALVFWLNEGRGYPFFHSLCNGFFVAAVMLLGVGGIRAARNKGTFDVAGFGLSWMAYTAFPFLRGDREEEDIHEYRQRKAQERRGAGGLLAAGAIYLALSVLALCLYYVG